METFKIVVDALTTNNINLSDSEIKGIEKSFCTRGPYKGYLQRNKPSGSVADGFAAAAWLGIQPNHHKASIMAIIMLDGEQKSLYTKLSKINFPACLDKDMEALQSMGAW